MDCVDPVVAGLELMEEQLGDTEGVEQSSNSECCGYTSFDDFAFWQREWCGSDDELRAKWMKTISK